MAAMRRRSNLVSMYVLALAATMAVLVVWIVYVVRSSLRLGDLNWLLLSVGCALLFFVLVALTYNLAQALAARRYAIKQDEFVSNITHEMKSPLAAIKLHAQTLLQQQDRMDDASRRRFLGTIEQQADRMAALVDAVLESSRLLARKRFLSLLPIEIGAFCETYFAAARASAESRGIRLHTEVAAGATILGSEEALRRVLDNLLDNAIRFSRPGGEVRCRVQVQRSGPQPVVRIEVEDDGVGIPKKDLGRVFERFHQARRDGPPQRTGGTGLGLAIVSGLVREMRGSVRAFSQEDRPGARLQVELPILEGPPGVGAS
jgi:signal transduction histidine kinase